jgi:RNA recognition motif-containing protein
VSSLSRTAAEDDLRQAFEPYGAVSSVNIVKDREKGATPRFRVLGDV